MQSIQTIFGTTDVHTWYPSEPVPLAEIKKVHDAIEKADVDFDDPAWYKAIAALLQKGHDHVAAALLWKGRGRIRWGLLRELGGVRANPAIGWCMLGYAMAKPTTADEYADMRKVCELPPFSVYSRSSHSDHSVLLGCGYVQGPTLENANGTGPPHPPVQVQSPPVVVPTQQQQQRKRKEPDEHAEAPPPRKNERVMPENMEELQANVLRFLDAFFTFDVTMKKKDAMRPKALLEVYRAKLNDVNPPLVDIPGGPQLMTRVLDSIDFPEGVAIRTKTFVAYRVLLEKKTTRTTTPPEQTTEEEDVSCDVPNLGELNDEEDIGGGDSEDEIQEIPYDAIFG